MFDMKQGSALCNKACCQVPTAILDWAWGQQGKSHEQHTSLSDFVTMLRKSWHSYLIMQRSRCRVPAAYSHVHDSDEPRNRYRPSAYDRIFCQPFRLIRHAWQDRVVWQFSVWTIAIVISEGQSFFKHSLGIIPKINQIIGICVYFNPVVNISNF